MDSNKGALSLLSEYGNNSSDDDVPSGRVSTKRSHKDEDKQECKNHTNKKLSLPSIITAKNKKSEHVDDPAVHDGRIRSFPHERDTWATYVYIPYEPNEGIQHIIGIIKGLFGEFKPINDFHISLTKVVILRHHWIESFVNTLKKSLVGIRSFIVMFDKLEVYCNEDRTRTFIGLEVKTGYDTLGKLVTILDSCLKEFRLPTFYKERKFHVSIAWCLGDQEEAVRMALPQLNTSLPEIMNNYPEDNWYILVDKLQCKVGNKYFVFEIS